MVKDTPHILLINPWIYDFAAFDFWAKPLGLLSIGGMLRGQGYQISYIDCLDRFHPELRNTLKTDKFGKGHYLKTTTKKNANVLQHMMGYFKKDLSSDEKQELLELIKHYRDENVPLIVPVTLFNHYVRKYTQDYLSGQTYLRPHPIALKLRNHV